MVLCLLPYEVCLPPAPSGWGISKDLCSRYGPDILQLIISIFHYLTGDRKQLLKLRGVNRTFARLVFDPALWSSFDLHQNPLERQAGDLGGFPVLTVLQVIRQTALYAHINGSRGILRAKFKFIGSGLDVVGSRRRSSWPLRSEDADAILRSLFSEHSAWLRSFEIDGGFIRFPFHSVVDDLLRFKWPSLEVLKIGVPFYSKIPTFWDFLRRISDKCPDLRSLDLTVFFGNPVEVTTIPSGGRLLKKLQILKLHSEPGRDSGVCRIDPKLLVVAFPGLRELQTDNFWTLGIPGTSTITECSLVRALEALPDLVKIRTHCPEGIDSLLDQLVHISEHSLGRSLQEISVSNSIFSSRALDPAYFNLLEENMDTVWRSRRTMEKHALRCGEAVNVLREIRFGYGLCDFMVSRGPGDLSRLY